MSKDVVMVLTSKCLGTMLAEGGSGNWKANEDRIRRCRWIVAVRNRHTDWSEGKEEHGTAFLVGRVAGVKISAEHEDRLVIVFDRYAALNAPNVWPNGFRNPVCYTTLEDLGINSEELKWKEFPGSSRAAVSLKDEATEERQLPSAVLEKAKLMIAASLSIAPSAVKISIQI
jgi:hypothetical protein